MTNEDAIRWLDNLKNDIGNPHYEMLWPYAQAIDEICFLLKEQEPKTGHWVSVNDGDVVEIDNNGFPERACFCSECKKYLIASDEYAVYGRYCPFCGAKMEGGEVNGQGKSD